MLIIQLEGEGELDLHSREFHVVQQHSIWEAPSMPKGKSLSKLQLG
jgi:hypothetical protein